MTYEERMKIIAQVKPEKKDILLWKLWKGEKIDLTQDEELFYQFNANRVSLDQFVDRDRFKAAADAVQLQKQGLKDPKHARTDNRKMRWLGDIPAQVYFNRPEFSPNLPPEERATNLKSFLNQFPKFKGVDGKV